VGAVPSEALEVRLQRRALALAEEALALAPAAGHRLDAQAVHRLRVICKKLRSVWELLTPALGRAAVRDSEQALRDVAALLSAPRQGHVLRRTVIEVTRHHGHGIHVGKRQLSVDQTMDVLLALIGERWPDSDETPAAEPILPVTFNAQLEALKNLPSQPSAELLCDGVLRCYRRARSSGRRALQRRDDAAWHRCRRWAKYELYQLELLVPEPQASGRWRRLERFGDRLGQFHDLCDLRALVAQEREQLRSRGALRPISAVLDRAARPLRRKMARGHAKLYARSPRERRARLGRRLLRR
jgi:CHAD domain-containing protein